MRREELNGASEAACAYTVLVDRGEGHLELMPLLLVVGDELVGACRTVGVGLAKRRRQDRVFQLEVAHECLIEVPSLGHELGNGVGLVREDARGEPLRRVEQLGDDRVLVEDPLADLAGKRPGRTRRRAEREHAREQRQRVGRGPDPDDVSALDHDRAAHLSVSHRPRHRGDRHLGADDVRLGRHRLVHGGSIGIDRAKRADERDVSLREHPDERATIEHR